jgi:hypothetical protein
LNFTTQQGWQRTRRHASRIRTSALVPLEIHLGPLHILPGTYQPLAAEYASNSATTEDQTHPRISALGPSRDFVTHEYLASPHLHTYLCRHQPHQLPKTESEACWLTPPKLKRIVLEPEEWGPKILAWAPPISSYCCCLPTAMRFLVSREEFGPGVVYCESAAARPARAWPQGGSPLEASTPPLHTPEPPLTLRRRAMTSPPGLVQWAADKAPLRVLRWRSAPEPGGRSRGRLPTRLSASTAKRRSGWRQQSPDRSAISRASLLCPRERHTRS